MATLTLIRVNRGSGKSTLAKMDRRFNHNIMLEVNKYIEDMKLIIFD